MPEADAIHAFLSFDSLSVALATAFAFGMAARLIGMPPMLGFLAAGFALSQFGVEPTEAGRRIADFGVLLLLFTIGLKLSPRMLAERVVLGTALGHMAATVALVWGLLMALGAAGLTLLGGLDAGQAALIAFALSFSSTVFTVKIFEEKGELGSVHGKAALGILIIQDIAAVAFLVLSTGAVPSIWAVALLGFLALPPVLERILERMGHGEMLPLFGLFAVLVLGAASFKAVGLKPDLGALVMGMLMAGQKRASEIADSLLGFKDIFLIGFFLNIGLMGVPSVEGLATAAALTALVVAKGVLFFFFLVYFRLRARTALLGALGLATFSEFGLIVGAVAVELEILPPDWLVALALAVALSFLLMTPVNALGHGIYARFSRRLRRFEAVRSELEDQHERVGGAEIVIFGMGRLGATVYRQLKARYGHRVIGVETDRDKVAQLREAGCKVIHGDACDSDFWVRAVRPSADIRVVVLAMPDHHANMYALRQIRAYDYRGLVAALARYPDEIGPLTSAGANVAFDVHAEAGAGFASDIARRIAAGAPVAAPPGPAPAGLPTPGAG